MHRSAADRLRRGLGHGHGNRSDGALAGLHRGHIVDADGAVGFSQMSGGLLAADRLLEAAQARAERLAESRAGAWLRTRAAAVRGRRRCEAGCQVRAFRSPISWFHWLLGLRRWDRVRIIGPPGSDPPAGSGPPAQVSLATITAGCVGTRVPPAGSGVTITWLTPAQVARHVNVALTPGRDAEQRAGRRGRPVRTAQPHLVDLTGGRRREVVNDQLRPAAAQPDLCAPRRADHLSADDLRPSAA